MRHPSSFVTTRRAWGLCLGLALGLAGVDAGGGKAHAEEAPAPWDTEGLARFSLQGGYDSNIFRDYEQSTPVSDLLGSAVVSLDGRASKGRWDFNGSYDGGARAFLHNLEYSLLTQTAHLEGSAFLTRRLAVGAEGGGKDKRGRDRPYSDFLGGAFVDLFPDARVDVRGRAGARRFLYWDNVGYSFRGPELGASLRYRLARRHSVTGYGYWASRLFSMKARVVGDDSGTEVIAPYRRNDTVLEAGIGYGYRGRVALGANYSYAESSSSSFGEAWRRHRVALTAGAPLPWQMTLLFQAQLQLTGFPDGVFRSTDVFSNQEDEENSNMGSVKWVRALGENLDVEARYALYHHVLDTAAFTYWRHLAWAGFTLRL